MAQADSASILIRPTPTSAVATAYAAGTWWIPVIDHPDRPSFVRFARYPRKAKPTYVEAITYAAAVIAWSEHFADFKRRKLEATTHPRWLRYFSQAAE